MNMNLGTNMLNEDLPVNRDFKGIWIPREIWLQPDLLPLEKLLWAEVHSLYDRNRGGCYASNEYLAGFLKTSIRYVSEIISKLKSVGFIKDVSFDGRTRVIRAVLPREDAGPRHPPDEESESEFQADMNHSSRQGGTTVPPCHDPQFHPHIYREKSREKRKNNTASAGADVSADADVENSSDEECLERKIADPVSKPARTKSVFSSEVCELGHQMLQAMKHAKPDYVPRNQPAFLKAVDAMLRIDGRDKQKLMAVFVWALSDSFWQSKMFKPNPADYLRKQFDQLDAARMKKPAQQPVYSGPKQEVESEDPEWDRILAEHQAREAIATKERLENNARKFAEEEAARERAKRWDETCMTQ